MTNDNQFVSWVLSLKETDGAEVEPAERKPTFDKSAMRQRMKAAEYSDHIELGQAIARRVKGTKQIEKLKGHEEESGSAWLAEEKASEVKAALRKMGFRPRGKTSFVRANFTVDVGAGGHFYVTDD